MFEALSSTLREGLSAFLVVAVMLAFFTRAGRHRFRNATRWGIALSAPATGLAAAMFSMAENQALWEGLLALAGAACVAWVAWHMWRTTRPGVAVPSRLVSYAAVCLVTVLMITRGAMEIALLLGTMVLQVPAWDVIVASALGPAIAIALGVVWSRAGQHVPRRTFAQVTAVFLCVLFIQLAIDGLHEVAESYVFSGADALHTATEPFSSEGTYGQYAQFLLLAIPVAWWLVAIFWTNGKGSDRSAVDVGR